MTMLSDLLRRDRERHGLRVAQAVWLLGVTPASFVGELEGGEQWPNWET